MISQVLYENVDKFNWLGVIAACEIGVSMNKEIIFKRNWTTIILAVGVTLFFVVFIAFIQFDSIKEGKTAPILAVLVIILLGCWATWELLNQKFVSYYDEGVGYISIFGKNYISWQDIKNVSISDSHIVMVASGKPKLKISLNDYREPEKLIKFLELKLLSRQNEAETYRSENQ